MEDVVVESEVEGLVDLDGTLANYHGEMQRQLALLAGPGEPPYVGGDAEPAWISARRHAIGCTPGFWLNLEPLPLGFEIVDMMRELKFKLHVLTKGPSNKPLAWGEKRQWCTNHIPDAKVTITEDKGLVYGRVLVDDWPPYYRRWKEWRPRGLVVVPAQPWNEGAENYGPNIIRYDGTNKDEVYQALVAARSR